jgi:translation initiation factor 2B subunit (eIF-2B alpha/beta/delta family)
VVANTCEQLTEESEKAVRQVAAYGSELIQDQTTVFTYSHSATVYEAFKVAAEKRKKFRLIITESRPLFEGRALAQELSRLGIPATLAVDASMGHLMKTADVCMVGADSVLSDGSVVNKVGTFPLAMSAHEHHKPFYVLCEKSKFNLRSMFEAQPETEERDKFEVLPHPPEPFLTVRNPYFDTTPSTLISQLITEDGSLMTAELPRAFRKMLSETYL